MLSSSGESAAIESVVGPSAWRLIRPIDVALMSALSVGLAAWSVAIARQPSDYDEVYHAHSVWLIAQRDRPFHDFLAMHPPFPWYVAAALLPWLPVSPGMLFPLRILAGIGTLLWLAILIANLTCNHARLSVRWMLAGVAVALFSTPVLAYAVEFRPDTWTYALFFGALFILRRPGAESTSVRRYALCSSIATAAVVCCLKLAPFALAFVVFDLLRLHRRGSVLRAALFGTISGAGVSLTIAWLLLLWMQIDARSAFLFAFRYQSLLLSNTGFSHGLLQSLLANPLPFLVACTGLLACGVQSIRTRRVPEPFDLTIVAVLIWQLVQVDWPYKQYSAPWLLLATPYFAYVEPGFNLRASRGGLLPGIVTLVAGLLAAASLARHRQNELGPLIRQVQNEIVALTAADSSIVAPPPFHAVCRRDVFFAWCRTTDPHGYTTESALRDLGYGNLVSAERYRDELMARPPALIVLPLLGEDLYEPVQWQELSKFLWQNSRIYDIVTVGQFRSLAVRRDIHPDDAISPQRE